MAKAYDLLSLLIGIVAGLRTLTTAAAVCWSAHLGWLAGMAAIP